MEKIALVTGSSRGIGRAIARELAREGWRVCINYRVRKDCAESLLEEITAFGGEAMIYGADVSRREEVNAMVAADTVLVPIQCEYYALEGLSQLIHTINLVRERLNETLDIEGIVFTMYDARTNLSAEVVETVKAHVQQKIYETVIPRNVRLAEAPSHGLPITEYDEHSSGAAAYRALAEEVIRG